MVLKLYGSRWSPNAKRVAIVLLEKKVPFQAIEVDMINKEHKTAAYIEKQPYGEVPYIVRYPGPSSSPELYYCRMMMVSSCTRAVQSVDISVKNIRTREHN